jgi:hypothetical protein
MRPAGNGEKTSRFLRQGKETAGDTIILKIEGVILSRDSELKAGVRLSDP